jgi:hypothetical protein
MNSDKRVATLVEAGLTEHCAQYIMDIVYELLRMEQDLKHQVTMFELKSRLIYLLRGTHTVGTLTVQSKNCYTYHTHKEIPNKNMTTAQFINKNLICSFRVSGYQSFDKFFNDHLQRTMEDMELYNNNHSEEGYACSEISNIWRAGGEIFANPMELILWLVKPIKVSKETGEVNFFNHSYHNYATSYSDINDQIARQGFYIFS